MSSSYGGFLKYGYPQIIHFRLAFSIINHPAIGVSPFMETPCFLFKWLFWGCPYFQTHPNSSLFNGAHILTSDKMGSPATGHMLIPNQPIWGVENYWTTTIFTFGKAFSPLKPTRHPVTRTRSPGRSLHSPWSRAWSQVFVPKEVQIKVACNGRSETNLPAKQSSANAKWKPSELEIVLKNGVSEHTH